jgi:(E)-4-hydroxy-3-methylbut-2-enyl-diphosphate synthase
MGNFPKDIPMTIKRRLTKKVVVGNREIGGNSDILIQSMTNIPTRNILGNVNQIAELEECGCDIVRLAVTSRSDLQALFEIKKNLYSKGILMPLVADVHFSPILAFDALEVADKVRINAGNFSDKISETDDMSDAKFLLGRQKLQDRLKEFFLHAKKMQKPIRIGINRGSLAPRMFYKFGNTDAAMWESAKECLEAAQSIDFGAIVLSFKASDVQATISSNHIACDSMDAIGWNFPLHLGVTESGDGEYARIKSAVGIGTLLSTGIGDTIRVSLTENPAHEVEVAKNILQACGIRRYVVEIVSCPSCGRTSYDIQAVLQKVKSVVAEKSFDKSLKIAVMGCVVNGLGEAEDADFAIVGNSNGTLSLYKGKTCLEQNISQSDIYEKLLTLVLTKKDMLP